MEWVFYKEGNTLSSAGSIGIKGAYHIDIWEKWFEARLDGSSINKYETLEDAISDCMNFDDKPEV